MYTNKNEIVNLDPNDHITVIPGANEIDYLTNTGCYWFMDEPMTVYNETGNSDFLQIGATTNNNVVFVNKGVRKTDSLICFYRPQNIKSIRLLSCAIFKNLGLTVSFPTPDDSSQVTFSSKCFATRCPSWFWVCAVS